MFPIEHSDEGTLSILITPGFSCYVLELPWRDNRKSRSCIPSDTYTVQIRRSRKYGLVYHIKDVEGRTFILAHSGNWAGDVDLGLKSHSEGCLLFGSKIGTLQGQRAVFNSRVTMRKFMWHMGYKDFMLVVNDTFNMRKVA